MILQIIFLSLSGNNSKRRPFKKFSSPEFSRFSRFSQRQIKFPEYSRFSQVFQVFQVAGHPEYIYIDFEKYTNLKITKSELLELFTFCTLKTKFLFDGVVYEQIDVIAMGLPLAPTPTNLFLGHYEGIWLNEYEGVPPLFYRRYVDDIFAVFENRDQAFGVSGIH